MDACEHCGTTLPAASYELFDYCADCGRNLCPACMAKGCCGSAPARSGMEAEEEYVPGGDRRRSTNFIAD